MNNLPTIGNILIIDDEKINAETIMDTLEDVNYKVVLATNAIEAKVAVKHQSFDLIMMDVWMHGQDGMSLLEEWVSANFTIPIIMMSGHAQHKDVIKAIKLGAVDFLKKPLHDILPLVRKILNENKHKKTTNAFNFNISLKSARATFEKQYFNYHLTANNNNIAKVADIAGLERTTLYRKLKDLGIYKK